MIVRELLTRIGFQVDKKTEKNAKDSFGKLRDMAGKLGLALSAGAVALGFKKVIDAASDAEETMNVVTTAFEDQADAVLEWAKVSGEAAGRSEFAMREYASQLGAVVGPTLGSAEATAQLSTDMAQLAVDLGSFFNATDEDALNAIRAGLIGSQEPLLRFGVNMSVAALDAFALERGLGKTTKQMTAAEKTTLRYQFILANTTKAQGDAAKTADGFANQSKRLQGNLLTLAVNVGKELLPASAGFLQTLNGMFKVIQGPVIGAVRSAMNAFRFLGAIIIGLSEGFKSLGAVAKAAIIVVAFFAIAFLAPWLLLPVLIGAAVAGAIAVLDDLWSAISGGESVLAGLWEEFQFQLGNTESWAEAMGEILKTSIDFWGELFFGWGNTTEMIGLWLIDIFDSIGRGIDSAIQWVTEVIDSAIKGWIDFFGGFGDAVGTVVRDLIVLFTEITTKVQEFFAGGIQKALDLAGGFLGAVGDLDKTFGLAGPENIAVPGSPAAMAARGDVNANQTIEVNVSAQGGDPAAIAAAVAPAVGRAAGNQNRLLKQQLLAGGATP